MSSQTNIASPLTLDSPLIQNSITSSPSTLSPSSRPVKKSSFSNVVSPQRRKSSSVSPNEELANLNPLELEAIAAVHELRALVKDVYVSDKLPRTPDLIYLNLTTLEGQPFCVELTSLKGWRVTSVRHDCMNGDIGHLDLHIRYFDTMHFLMEHVSPEYEKQMKEILVDINAAAPGSIGGARISIEEKEIDKEVNAEDHTFT